MGDGYAVGNDEAGFLGPDGVGVGLDPGVARNHAAAFAISDGVATAWDPDVISRVYSLLIDDSIVTVGGDFRFVDGRRLARDNFVRTAVSDGMAY